MANSSLTRTRLQMASWKFGARGHPTASVPRDWNAGLDGGSAQVVAWNCGVAQAWQPSNRGLSGYAAPSARRRDGDGLVARQTTVGDEARVRVR